jgi:hypothetical protein
MSAKSYTEVRNQLVSLFTKIEILQYPEVRQQLLNEMRARGYPLTVVSSNFAEIHSVNILDAALRHKGALHQLGVAISMFDTSKMTIKFTDLIDELLPSEFFELEERFDYVAFIRSSIPVKKLGAYYSAVTNDIPETDFADADTLVRELEGILPQEGCHPLVLLTEAIAQQAAGRRVREAREWSDRVASNIDDAMGDN